jgi:serine/threonine protein kinase
VSLAALLVDWADAVNGRNIPPATWRGLVQRWRRLEPELGPWRLPSVVSDGAQLTDMRGHASVRIERRIGQGGNGAVYQARVDGMEGPVAIKLPNAWRRVPHAFLEARPVVGRKIPGIVRHYAVEILQLPEAQAVVPALLLDYLPGGSLGQRLGGRRKGGGAMPVGEAAQLLIQLCHGLQALQIVHRDIKPDNILYDAAQRPHLADFGISLPLDAYERVLYGYQTKTASGTPGYMSPEQANTIHHIDQRSDIYALGVLFFQLLTRHMPCPMRAGEDARQYLQRAVDAPMPLEAVNDPAARAVIAGCTGKNPSERYLDHGALRHALYPLAEGQGFSGAAAG